MNAVGGRTRRAQALVAMLIALCVSAAGAATPPVVGDVPPPYVGKRLDGSPVMLTNYAGKAIVVSFWASWCPY